MASTDFVYGKARIALNSAQINLASAAVDAMLVNNLYAPNPNTDQHVSDIPSAAIIVRDATLTGNGLSASGAFFGMVPQFNALLSVTPCVAIILYVKTGSDATSSLLYYSSSGPGFPFLPQGFDYVVAFDQNSGGFFQ